MLCALGAFGASSPLKVGTVESGNEQFLIDIALDNTCVTFYNGRNSLYRAQLVSARAVAIIHAFTEYTNGYQRVASVRRRVPSDVPTMAQCMRARLGVLVPFSCNNVYHQTFHAVPSSEHYAHGHSAPPARGYPNDTLFVPLVHASAAIGRKMPAEPSRWHAWEYTLRALTAATADEIAQRTSAMLTAGCACFERVEGTGAAFNPVGVGSTPRLRAFRDAALRHARLLRRPPVGIVGASAAEATSRPHRLLYFSRRHARRAVLNEAALLGELHRISAEVPAGRAAVERVVLESLPMVDQMDLVATASAIATVHGQAMAWVLFLPSSERRTAAIELMPYGFPPDQLYRRLSRAAGVWYQRVGAPLAGGCAGRRRFSGRYGREEWLLCNVSVNVEPTAAAVQRALEWCARPGTGTDDEIALRLAWP